ncbi:MAG: hypothetical protein GKR88_20180 [Flavobacteriaceae bacterium]|nr:MAG: hypothetical protein GKR88_20180 [Flavobacteriaceae bacterium]
MLVPRVALTARSSNDSIGARIVTSMMVYNTATFGIAPDNVIPGYYYWDGIQWKPFSEQRGIYRNEVTYHAFNTRNFCNNCYYWMPSAGGDSPDDSETSRDSYKNIWVAPYSGRLLKVIIRISSDSSNPGDEINSAYFLLSVDGNQRGSDYTYSCVEQGCSFSGSGTYSISGEKFSVDNGRTVIITSDTPWTFNEGQLLSIGWFTDNITEDNDYFVTAVWEYYILN